MEFNYHRQLVAQKGACAPRSYYIPFPEPEFSFDKRRSAFVTELKNWQFGYFPSLPEDALGAALPHAVKVPHCWQRDGFGKDMYSNIAYPFRTIRRISTGRTPAAYTKRGLTFRKKRGGII